MTNQEQRIERAGKLSVIANKEWLSSTRELLISFNREQVSKAVLAALRLDFAQDIASTDPDISFYLLLQQKAFLSAFDRGAIQPVSEITSLGWGCIEKMRRDTGIGIELLNSPSPEPVLTPAQKLEAQVRDDWKNLPSKQIKQKANSDRAYRECLDRIAGTFDSQVTTHTVIGA